MSLTKVPIQPRLKSIPTLQVDTLRFDFDATVAAQVYDQLQHYTTVWNAAPGGQKAVDVVGRRRDADAEPLVKLFVEPGNALGECEEIYSGFSGNGFHRLVEPAPESENYYNRAFAKMKSN